MPTINTETPTDSSPATDLIDEISFFWDFPLAKSFATILPKHCYNIGDFSYIFISSFGWTNVLIASLFFYKGFLHKTLPHLRGSHPPGAWENLRHADWVGNLRVLEDIMSLSLERKTGIFWTKHILNSIHIEVIQLPVEHFDRVFLEASFCGSAGISLTPGCFECLGDGMR